MICRVIAKLLIEAEPEPDRNNDKDVIACMMLLSQVLFIESVVKQNNEH